MLEPDEEPDIFSEAEELLLLNFSQEANMIGPPTVDTRTETLNSKMSGAISSGNESEDSHDSVQVSASAVTPEEEEEERLHGPHGSTLYVWLLSAFAALGGFLFGYDTGVISGAMLLLRDEFSLSSFWQEFVVSVTIAAAFLSALLGGYLNDVFGRKVVTIISSFIFTVGAVVLGFAQNVAMLVAGRLTLGIGIGLASMTVPVYIAESAPPHLRGRLVTVNNLFITGGQFVASLMDGGFSYIRPGGWRYMLGLSGVPSFIQFCGFFFVPESPRWLIKKGKEMDARAVLIKLRGSWMIETELEEMKQSVSSESQNHGGFVFLKIWRRPSVRRAVIVGCGLQLVQQLCGINTVMYYSATILHMSGVSDQHKAIWLSALTAGINFSFTLVGLWLVERLGRRKLIMGSLLGVCMSLVVLAVAFQLVAVHSPPVQQLNSSYINFTCSKYSWCESCIENQDCGFCYTGKVGSINGSCLAAVSGDTSYSSYGLCQKGSSASGQHWALDYCPTSYSWMAVLGLVLYLMFFAPGMGPMPWTINAEIYPTWARSSANSLSAATNWISNLLVSMTFLTLTEELTKYGTYWLFVGVAVLGLVFIGVCLPETKGHKLEEMEDLFSQPWSFCGQPGDQRSQYRSLQS